MKNRKKMKIVIAQAACAWQSLDMKTIRQLNREAAEWVAYNWINFSEQILEGGKNPASLTQCLQDKTYCRLNLIPELFYEQAEKENKRWWVSDENWEQIKALAKHRAEQSLRFLGAEKYPRTIAHFTNKG